MIRINLASKKVSTAAGGGIGAKKFFELDSPLLEKFLGSSQINLDAFRDLPIKRVAGPAVIAIVLYFGADFYQASEMSRAEGEQAIVKSESETLKKELAETKKVEPLKRQLEDDEQKIRNKIETISQLIAERQTPPKVLLELSKVIPPETWLMEFKLDSGEIGIKGYSTKFAEISDLVKGLGESVFFKDLQIIGTARAKDALNRDVTNFELKAKRRVDGSSN